MSTEYLLRVRVGWGVFSFCCGMGMDGWVIEAWHGAFMGGGCFF